MWRVVILYHDDGAFGYTAPPIEKIIADGLTRAEGKAIYNHWASKYWYNEWVSVHLEHKDENGWSDISFQWAFTEMEKQEQWFMRKGLDYNWWLMFDEIRKVD